MSNPLADGGIFDVISEEGLSKLAAHSAATFNHGRLHSVKNEGFGFGRFQVIDLVRHRSHVAEIARGTPDEFVQNALRAIRPLPFSRQDPVEQVVGCFWMFAGKSGGRQEGGPVVGDFSQFRHDRGTHCIVLERLS